MATTYSDITKSLQKAVANNPTGLPVQYENISISSNNTSYLRATTFINDNQMAELGAGGCNRYEGVLQLDIFCPSNKGGLDSLLTYLDQLATYFYPDRRFDSGLVKIKLITIEGRINGDGWIMQPISINWDSYAPRPTI